MGSSYKKIKKYLSKDWYVQGFNAVPIFLNLAAYSGMEMKKYFGFGYSAFIHNFKKGYGEMWYLKNDFRRIWKNIKEEISKDPGYLAKVKKDYFSILKKNEKILANFNWEEINNLDDIEIITFFRNASQTLQDSVGIAHIVDAIGIEIEKEFKKILLNEIENKKRFNEYFSYLTIPSGMSFISREEMELRKISKLFGDKKRKALKIHSKKYFWLQNSYAGPKEINEKFFSKRIIDLQNSSSRFSDFKTKIDLIKKLKLSKKTVDFVNVIDFITIWQDARKEIILRNIGYFGRIINEIGRRAKIKPGLIYYLGSRDVKLIKSLGAIKTLKEELKRREKGVFFLTRHKEEISVSGDGYDKLISYYKKISTSEMNKSELHGTVANTGTAIGRVVVCKSLRSISKVSKGDIIVASMTRPEFMPALKKAAAIVTDEGGLTCHAAIIARELNIPAVIGTKNATKILKDGMTVEVRANHGLVRIL